MATGVKKAAAKKTAGKKSAVKKVAAKKAPAKKAATRQPAIVRPAPGNNIQLGHALTSSRSAMTLPQFQNCAALGGGVIIGPTPGRHNADMETFRTVYSIALHGGAIVADVAIRFRNAR